MKVLIQQVAAALMATSAAFGQSVGIDANRGECAPQWLPTGGVNGLISAMALLPDGSLIVGGAFTTAGGQPANRIARWDGNVWWPLGSGMNNWVRALAVLPNGDVIAGGAFTNAGGIHVNRIARWDGKGWLPLGSGFNDWVLALAVLHDGDIVAGGWFTNAGGVSANGIARWDGLTWSPMGDAFPPYAEVNALTVHPDGSLIAGGAFFSSVLHGVARWDGIQWTQYGTALEGGVRALALLPNGNLAAGGDLHGPPLYFQSGIAISNGITWTWLGCGVSGELADVYALAAYNGDLFVGGQFVFAGDANCAFQQVNYMARWVGSEWTPLGIGMGSNTWAVYALAVLPGGELAVGGSFTTAGGLNSYCFARWTDFNIPWVAQQPRDSSVPCGSASFNVTPASGYPNLQYQWRKDGTPLADGPTPHGSIIAGATTSSLTINGVHQEDAGRYDAIVSNVCGSVTSAAATLSVPVCGDITGDGHVDVNDLVALLVAWGPCPPMPAECPADIAPPPTGDGVVDVNDLLMVINNWG